MESSLREITWTAGRKRDAAHSFDQLPIEAEVAEGAYAYLLAVDACPLFPTVFPTVFPKQRICGLPTYSVSRLNFT